MKLGKINRLLIAGLLLFISCNDSKEKRYYQSLNGQWEIAETTNGDSIPVDFNHTIQVPSFVDMALPAFQKLDFPNDTNRYFWYRKQFLLDHENAEIVELEIRKAKYSAHVYVNGQKAGVQNLAYSSAKFNIKEFLKSSNKPNELLVRIGTRENFPDTLICGADFEKKTFFPGIFDDVTLMLKKAPYIEHVQIAPDIDNHLVKAFVEVKTVSHTEPFVIDYKVVEHKSKRVVATGKHQLTANMVSDATVELEVPMENYTLWSPENPFLYELKLSTDQDEETTRFGMRSFTIDNENKKFLLNNKPYFLLGTNVAIYRFMEDASRAYKPWDEQWVRKLFTKFKEMNWNSFRFHVGPAPDLWYEIADEMGFLIQDEYSIWYGKGGIHSLDPRITPEQLAVEYENWMRDRWNHPSIVIWDAQNETVSRITGLALEMVRSLDHSNRPWDNGYSRPTRETDMIESHPYLLYEYSLKDAKAPEEGIMKHLFGKIKDPYNDPNEQDPSEDGTIYENTTIINEYGWLWLNRDGSPTTLTDNVYDVLFKDAQTPEERFKIYARTLAAMTEYWRAHQKVAGIQHFAGLTYSRPAEPRGQTCDAFKNLESLEINEAFLKYVKPAFSKVAVMADVWEKQYPKGKNINVPVYIINDSDNLWKGEIYVAIYQNEKLINKWPFATEVNTKAVKKELISIELPERAGSYELRVLLNFNNQEVVSYRDVNIK